MAQVETKKATEKKATEKKTRTKRPLADRLKTMGEDKLRALASKATAELKAIGVEAARRQANKSDLSDLASLAA